MPKSRVRAGRLRLEKFSPRPLRSDRVSFEDAVIKGIEALEQQIASQDEIIEALYKVNRELQLQVRYTMETFKYEKKSPIIGGVTSSQTLYDLYLNGDRQRFIAKLLEQEKASHGASVSTDGGTTPGGDGRGEATRADGGGTDGAGTVDDLRSSIDIAERAFEGDRTDTRLAAAARARPRGVEQ